MKYKDFRLETDRLLLRLFTSDDVEDCYSMLSLEEVVKNVNLQVQTLDEVRVFMSEMIEGYNLNTPEQLVKFTVAVVWKETGRVIGWVGLSPIKFDPGSIEIYYGFHPDFWGAGIATEAATAMLRFGFAELNLLQIVGLTHPHNHASSHVLEKIGLFYRWTIHDLPEEFRYFESCNYFSLSKSDFIQIQNNKQDKVQ
jgi:ribosomal-protein-alanine N-acetyltransferase